MKLKQYLQEEFADYVRIGRKNVAVYKNPSRKELSDIVKDANDGRIIKKYPIRFILDFVNKNIYAWDADYLHVDIAYALGIDYYITNDKYFFGTAQLYSDEPKLSNFASFGSFDKGIAKRDWTFAEKILDKKNIDNFKNVYIPATSK